MAVTLKVFQITMKYIRVRKEARQYSFAVEAGMTQDTLLFFFFCFFFVSPMVVAFSWHVRILGEFSTIHSSPSLLFLSSFFFFIVEISSCTLIPLLRPGSVHSGSTS